MSKEIMILNFVYQIDKVEPINILSNYRLSMIHRQFTEGPQGQDTL